MQNIKSSPLAYENYVSTKKKENGNFNSVFSMSDLKSCKTGLDGSSSCSRVTRQQKCLGADVIQDQHVVA